MRGNLFAKLLAASLGLGALALSGAALGEPDRVAPAAHVTTEDTPPRKIRSGTHFVVAARDLRLGELGLGKLQRIAARYFKATNRKLTITGGTRTPERQAELMREKLAHGEDIFRLYENHQAAKEIRAAYLEGVSQKLPKKRLVKAMREVIDAQIARGIFVSRHLQSGAVDVRSRGMSPAQQSAFRAAVAGEAGVALLDERTGAEPHFHLSL